MLLSVSERKGEKKKKGGAGEGQAKLEWQPRSMGKDLVVGGGAADKRN